MPAVAEHSENIISTLFKYLKKLGDLILMVPCFSILGCQQEIGDITQLVCVLLEPLQTVIDAGL